LRLKFREPGLSWKAFPPTRLFALLLRASGRWGLLRSSFTFHDTPGRLLRLFGVLAFWGTMALQFMCTKVGYTVCYLERWKKTWELIPGCIERHTTTTVASSSLSRLAGNLIVCSRRKAGSRQVSQYCQMRDGSKRSGRGFVCNCFPTIKARQLRMKMHSQKL
jgi:hypothetical protein